MRLKKSFIWYAQNLTGGLTVCGIVPEGDPALGRGRRSRPARKMLRRVKLLGMCARRPQGRQSPESGAYHPSSIGTLCWAVW
ncbi:MAG: hypothetical protein IH588_19165 [Anaerolineales bacterium]|nr:hypothetical protein [Anaerolineales bacterium]